MRIAISGSRGLIGTALTQALTANGHTVVRLVRGQTERAGDVLWNPRKFQVNLAQLERVDAIVNLAGAGVGDRYWTPQYKRILRNSRLQSTLTLARAAAALRDSVKTFISASAIGYYGDTGTQIVDETGAPGAGFLAELCQDWERAADPARTAGVRVVHPRTGLVVAEDGGAWQKLLPLFKAGVGGRMGNGQQYWSFISLRDTVAALIFALEKPHIRGPVNLTAPNPITNAEATAITARYVGKPAVLPVPAKALELALGGFSIEVLGSHRVLPRALSEAGFTFQDPVLADALAAL